MIKRKIQLLLILLILIMLLPIVSADIHPNMFLNQSEINRINTIRNQEPWLSAYNSLMNEAKTICNANILGKCQTPLYSVTFQGRTTRNYYTDSPYSTDGVSNPNADRADYSAAINVGKAVRTLGLAYSLTGESKYAEKAVELIKTWSTDTTTGMNPNFTNYQSRIEISITIPGIFYGADLIWNYPGWSYSDKNAFRLWSSELLRSAKTWSANNNYENWRLLLISSGSVVAEDSVYRNYAFDRWKAIVPLQISTEGKMVEEIDRTTSLAYSLYSINAMAQTAEIARHFNVDLYNYKYSGKGLELVLDYHAPFILNPSSWPYQQINPLNCANTATYELAYTFKQKTSYMNVIEECNRPMKEIRVMGPVTLTHSYTSTKLIIPTPTQTSTPVPTIPTPTPTPTYTTTPTPTITPTQTPTPIPTYTVIPTPTPVPTVVIPQDNMVLSLVNYIMKLLSGIFRS